MSAPSRRPTVKPPAVSVSATPSIAEKFIKSRIDPFSELDEPDKKHRVSAPSYRANSGLSSRPSTSKKDHLSSTVHSSSKLEPPSQDANPANDDSALADELDFVTVESMGSASSRDKASRFLGIKHRKSMEPIPASARTSMVSSRSYREPPPSPSFVPTLPLTSLYLVSGLPKSPHTWTLADPDSVIGLHHSEGAVNRWWRPEVLGSTISHGAGGGKRKKKGKGDGELMKGAGALTKQEVGKMLSKALKLSFTREVEIIASTLQPASTIHSFTFTLPAPNTPLAPITSSDLLRASVISNTDHRSSAATFNYPYSDDPFQTRPTSGFLGPSSLIGHAQSGSHVGPSNSGNGQSGASNNTVTYHGVCLTVWSHADAERSNAIRRTLEAGRSRKESSQSAVASRIKNLRADITGADPRAQARRTAKKSSRGPWATDGETDADTEGDGMSESEVSTIGHGPGESTLFLPGDTVFWLPYALTLVSRHPIYDLMRDYLTLSWARFSKDVQSHTLQISKILSHPAPRAGDLIRLDASAKNENSDASLEVIARFPGGLDFGRGLVDVNFTMWPLFKCLNIDNILTICEIALAPTGRVMFFSRHPAMLGIAVYTIKYLVELRGWNGIALSAVHSRDAKIYIDDPGPWILGLATEVRYSIRPASEVCVVDLDINYLSCANPPHGVVSTRQQRDRYRQRLLQAFEPHYHPDHSVPSEFKEAFPAGRFRPVCKIQAKRGASSSAIADTIKAPEWWHSTRIIQAFDAVLQDKFKKPSFLKRITSFGLQKRPPQLTSAELMIQHSIRKRATAFVDARDDLETKIGRLSRRLNFLMTESDLWRDKFVTFEQYAEKLSAEANQLRAKINKEQRETKRLSGLVTLTAAEKTKLQNQLKDTESAHKDAMLELDRMKETMEKMEVERAEMVAEVEAQIERALQSMTVDIDDSDYEDSRPPSRLSNISSEAAQHPDTAMNPLRSSSTESTLAESYDAGGDEAAVAQTEQQGDKVEEPEDEKVDASKKKRFSASQVEVPQDGMVAVDESISQRSDKIAQKVLEIQQKLETALAAERLARMRSKGYSSAVESDADLSESTNGRSRSRTARRIAKAAMKTRNRSATSSTFPGEGGTKVGDLGSSPEALPVRPLIAAAPPKPDSVTQTNPAPPIPEQTVGDKRAVDRNPSPPLSVNDASYESASTPALTAASATADDSDTDFQSARSTSPRDSYGDWERDTNSISARASVIMGKDDHIPKDTQTVKAMVERPKRRSRTNSATTVVTSSRDGLAPEKVAAVRSG